MRPSLGRNKGLKFERDISETLSNWIFQIPNMLKREPTSGAIKTGLYIGDVIPVGNLQWSRFPFFLELKIGYKGKTPTLSNQQIVRTWISKCISQRTEKQCIIWLICKFHYQSEILITDVLMNTVPLLILNHIENGEVIPFYIYELKELLRYNFYDLYRHNQLLMEVLEPSI